MESELLAELLSEDDAEATNEKDYERKLMNGEIVQ